MLDDFWLIFGCFLVNFCMLFWELSRDGERTTVERFITINAQKGRDGEGQRGTARDDEGQRGTARDSEGQRRTARDNEGQRGTARDSEGQRGTTRDSELGPERQEQDNRTRRTQPIR